MTYSGSVLLVALVAFSFQLLRTAAAPLDKTLPIGQVIWEIPTTVTVLEATVTVIIPPLSPSASAGAATNSQPNPTATNAKAATVAMQSAATTTYEPSSTDETRTWALPEIFEDLAPFNIEKLAYGSANIAIVTGIPANASATSTAPHSATGAPPSAAATQFPRLWTNSSSAYRLFYPAGSINPGNTPQGGSDFYAVPGDLPFGTANNVTLEYSVFFPADFEWVQGGKLPGLYGGHMGCSGGNDATSCFSTRLMWRKGGAGELYLYAPKDKQTPELCNTPPQSSCDTNYGLSVGRGSFHFTAGAWTHVSQTVRLNTPGKQDGGFELVVDGQRVIRRDDVFYRDEPDTQGESDGESGLEVDPVKREAPRRSLSTEVRYNGLPPLLPLGSVVGDIFGDQMSSEEDPAFSPDATFSDIPNTPPSATNGAKSTHTVPPNPLGGKTVSMTSTIVPTRSLLGPVAPSATTASSSQEQSSPAKDEDGAIRFAGLFFRQAMFPALNMLRTR